MYVRAIATGKQVVSQNQGVYFMRIWHLAHFFMFYISFSKYIAVIWKYMWISSTLMPANLLCYQNQLQAIFQIFELFLKYPDVAQFRWLCTHEHLHENDDGGIQHVLLKMYAFWTTSSDNFYFIFIFVFLDRLYNNTGWSFSTNFHIYYRKIDLIYYIWCM